MSHNFGEDTQIQNVVLQPHNKNEPGLYIPGQAYEIYPNVFVECGTKIYCKHSTKGKMQQMAFNWAKVYVDSIANLSGSIDLLKEISYTDSQLYFPSQFGYITNQSEMIQDVTDFSTIYSAGSVWFPANGWVFDEKIKHGVVSSGGKKRCFYHFCVEVQFRQTSNVSVVTNDCWSFFINKKLTKFYQIKEWLDGRVRRVQPQRTPNNNEILILDTNNINLLPFPPTATGTTIISISVVANAVP